MSFSTQTATWMPLCRRCGTQNWKLFSLSLSVSIAVDRIYLLQKSLPQKAAKNQVGPFDQEYVKGKKNTTHAKNFSLSLPRGCSPLTWPLCVGSNRYLEYSSIHVLHDFLPRIYRIINPKGNEVWAPLYRLNHTEDTAVDAMTAEVTCSSSFPFLDFSPVTVAVFSDCG